MQLDESQMTAIENALSNKDSVITGGAGTGKTTIMREIVNRMNGKAELLAPTGKAAARLREASGIETATIHRWLKWDGKTITRKARAEYPIIIDEASMVDSWLLARVLEFNPPKLILVGDSAQLPAVGKGQPFHDIVKYRPSIVSTLTTCYRSQAAVHKAASAIRKGEMPEKFDEAGGEKWAMVGVAGAVGAENKILAWIRDGQYDPKLDIILTPRNGDNVDHAGTVKSLNDKIVKIVNPRKRKDEKWRVGDRIMNTKNNTELDWFNGDTGTVMNIDQNGCLWVKPDRVEDGKEQKILIPKELMSKQVLAYAITCHKSQGSQYRNVFILALKAHSHMLTRSLIYTAVTRAQCSCVVVGQLGAFRTGIKTTDTKRTVLQFLASKAA